MTAWEYWKQKFGEAPRTDSDKLAVAMMTEYAQEVQRDLLINEGKCDVCGCHPSIIYKTPFGTFCQLHAKY